MVIEIRALDTLFFRDGKPFSMGDETWADGMFPPNPTVIRGALRSLYFSSHQGEYETWIKDRNAGVDPTESLQIDGLFLQKINLSGVSEFLYPAPKDLVVEKERNEPKARLLKFVKLDGYTSSPLPMHFSWDENSRVETPGVAFVDHGSLTRYLEGNEAITFYEPEQLWSIEPKVGIGRSSTTHGVDEGKLYRVGMHRPQTKDGYISLIVAFSGLQLPQNGALKLGGEGKTAYYQESEWQPPFPPSQILDEENRFKIYLATPAIFDQGWRPAWLKNVQKHNGLKLEIVGAAIGNPLPVGGFDMKLKKDKVMKYAVPAGSVYILQVKSPISDRPKTEKQLKELFHNQLISDSEEYKHQGYGLTFIGALQ